jgi:citrate lyase subunit beta/citryl-CoA lyase
MVETPEAIFNIKKLAARATDSPLSCLVMGTNDLAKELRAALGAGSRTLAECFVDGNAGGAAIWAEHFGRRV